MTIVTRPLDDFFPLIQPQASACPIPMIEQALRLAAVEFCERTRCWRHMIRRDVTRATLNMVAPIYATIHEIETATWEGNPLTPTQFSNVQNDIENPVASGNPMYITQVAPGSITLIPFVAGHVVLSVFLKPKVADDLAAISSYAPGDQEINVLPEFLLVQHGETLAAGALTRILALPHQSFTDPNRAGGFQAIFERGVNTHFARNIRGQHRAAPRSRANYF